MTRRQLVRRLRNASTAYGHNAARAERRARRVDDVDAEVAALQREADLEEDDWMNELPEEYVRALQRGDKVPDLGDALTQASNLSMREKTGTNAVVQRRAEY